jgi:hypothetical protein
LFFKKRRRYTQLEDLMIARVLALLLLVTGGVTAATVQTHVKCYGTGPLGVGFYIVEQSGTFSAACNTLFYDKGQYFPDIETASINPGVISIAHSSSDYYIGGGLAEADFSARYLFTLTGADKLFDFGPEGLGAFVLPCLTVSSTGPNYAANTAASLGSIALTSTGSTCPNHAPPIPVLLNKPTTMNLTLNANSNAGPPAGVADASAAFSGFLFFDAPTSSGSPMNATYTFTLQEQLVPEPGSLFLVAPVVLLWPVLRLRTRKP